MPKSFDVGDVVERLRAGISVIAEDVIEKGTLGTICRIITPGRTYKIRYVDFDICVVVFHDSVRKAPAGSIGPICEEDC